MRSFALLPVFALYLGAQQPAGGPDPKVLKQAAAEMIEARRTFTQHMVDSIFSFSELGYEEKNTADYVTGLLAKERFAITRGGAGMPTAFMASWGSGKPVIGLMADIDGLPETSQKPGVAWHEPLIPNGPGHGEGHNAGQAVNVTAAIAVKQLMQKNGIKGTIRLYAGVAEELLGSRTYMVNAGLFKDLDIMLSSHISNDFTTGYGAAGSGLVSTKYTFYGRSAHSAGSPWAGRSALDAVELMNTAWNFRREHLRPEHRSHYVITQGGDQPNVVPPVATVWYYFREWEYEKIKELHELGSKMAQAATMMTDTTVSEQVLGAAWPGHYNKPLAEALHANIQKIGMPQWSEADQQFARAAQTVMKSKAEGLKMKVPDLKPPVQFAGGGSDDIAEVSWNLPTVVLRYPGNIPGMIGHHWSSGMAMATPIAHKGATAGAKAHAMTMIDLFTNPALVESAKLYFAEQTRTVKWQSLIPLDAKPPVTINRERMDRFRPALDKLRYDPTKYATYMEQLGIRYPAVRQP